MCENGQGVCCYVFVGTYNESNQAGLHVLRFDPLQGQLKWLSSTSGVANPSFLCVDKERLRLYVASETMEGAVVAYRLDPKRGELEEINRRSTAGAAPCYVSLNETGTRLFAVNYQSGSVCVFPIRPDGSIAPMVALIQHAGHSVHAERQEAPHPHAIVPVPWANDLLVPDLGVDKIYSYGFDDAQRSLIKRHETQTIPGSGPRHIAFHPTSPVVYVINELNCTISVYSYERQSGVLLQQQTTTTLPGDYDGVNICADIHVLPSGRYLYGSNRGHDSIAAFRIRDNGLLAPIGHTAAQGRTPRNFCIVPGGEFLLVANQDSDSIVVMAIGNDGVPHPTGQQLEIPHPVCLRVLADAK